MVCPICQSSIKPGENTAILSEKGADAANNTSKERGSSISVKTGNEVHTACRRNFCDRRRIDREKNAQRKLEQKEPVAAPRPDLQFHALIFRRTAYSVVKQ